MFKTYSYANHFYFSNTYHKLKAPYQGVLIIARSAIIAVTLAKKNWEGKTYISQLEFIKQGIKQDIKQGIFRIKYNNVSLPERLEPLRFPQRTPSV